MKSRAVASGSRESRICPRCGMATDWSAEVAGPEDAGFTYWQCRRCAHIWVPNPPAAPLWPDP